MDILTYLDQVYYAASLELVQTVVYRDLESYDREYHEELQPSWHCLFAAVENAHMVDTYSYVERR